LTLSSLPPLSRSVTGSTAQLFTGRMARDYSSGIWTCCHIQVFPPSAIRPVAGACWVAASVTASKAAFRPPKEGYPGRRFCRFEGLSNQGE
jgi:hypothetical protein